MSTWRSRAGFTLFELLVVLAVLSVVSTIGTGALIQIMDHWRISSSRHQLGKTADTVLDIFEKDVQRVVSAQLAGLSIRGAQQTAQSAQFFRVNLEDDRIVLPIEDVHPATGMLTHHNVMYRINRAAEPPVLERVAGPLGPDDPQELVEPLEEGALALRVEFQDPQGNWQSHWEGPAHPQAVRLSIVLALPDAPMEQVARSRTCVVRVQ